MSAFAELHDDLRSVARDVLVGTCSWSTMVDAGWSSLEVPEHLGGAGATFAELAVVLEELGRAAAPSPVLGSAVLGVAAGSDDVLAAVAEGTPVAVALAPTGESALAEAAFRLDGDRVSGEATFVVDAPEAERLLLLCDGGRIATVDAGAVTVERQPVVDETRSFGTVVADGAPATVHELADAQAVLDRAALAVAIDGVGLAAAMLDATVAYAKDRTQFDQPIGSFQAVKHQCADMLVALTIARELVGLAVAEPTGRNVAMASSYASQMAVDVAGTALQLHGGIGYTWEGGIHVHLKRAILDRVLFGSPAAQRRRLRQPL
jgi:alkylation response protein AidB-like acyl-CoA dehydrogenase